MNFIVYNINYLFLYLKYFAKISFIFAYLLQNSYINFNWVMKFIYWKKLNFVYENKIIVYFKTYFKYCVFEWKYLYGYITSSVYYLNFQYYRMYNEGHISLYIIYEHIYQIRYGSGSAKKTGWIWRELRVRSGLGSASYIAIINIAFKFPK